MTLQALAQALGHSAHGYISEIERGRKVPTVAFVLGVSRMFRMPTDYLLRHELDLPLAPKPPTPGV